MSEETRKNLIRKFTSRKFWLAVVTFITCICVFLGSSSETVERISSLIMAGGTIIAYIIGEGLADSSPTIVEQYYNYDGTENYGNNGIQ